MLASASDDNSIIIWAAAGFTISFESFQEITELQSMHLDSRIRNNYSDSKNLQHSVSEEYLATRADKGCDMP